MEMLIKCLLYMQKHIAVHYGIAYNCQFEACFLSVVQLWCKTSCLTRYIMKSFLNVITFLHFVFALLCFVFFVVLF